MDTIVKREFLKRILNEEKKELNHSQGRALQKFLNFHTGETESTREYKVQMNGDGFLSGQLTAKLRANIRFLDIKRKTVKKKNGNLGRRKVRKIYNTPVYRSYYSLAREVMFGFTNEVAEGIKRDLNLSSNG